MCTSSTLTDFTSKCIEANDLAWNFTQLAIDCFITDVLSNVQYMELVNALDILAGRLKHNGIFIIVDIEKLYGYADSTDETLIDGRKEGGHGSGEVIAALKDVGT